jgi:hypothetical protein
MPSCTMTLSSNKHHITLHTLYIYYLRFSLVRVLISTVNSYLETLVSACYALNKCVEQILSTAVAKSRAL